MVELDAHEDDRAAAAAAAAAVVAVVASVVGVEAEAAVRLVRPTVEEASLDQQRKEFLRLAAVPVPVPAEHFPQWLLRVGWQVTWRQND